MNEYKKFRYSINLNGYILLRLDIFNIFGFRKWFNFNSSFRRREIVKQNAYKQPVGTGDNFSNSIPGT